MKLTTAQRNRLPDSAFAIPEWRWGPLTGVSHVRNAASRLEHEHNVGRITGARYAQAKRRIASAAKRYHTSSMYSRDNPLMEGFWETPTGIGIQIIAGIGVVVSVYTIVRDWNAPSTSASQTAAYTAPAAATTLLAAF